MSPNPHVPKLYSRQMLEELERRDSIVQHAAMILKDHGTKETPSAQHR